MTNDQSLTWENHVSLVVRRCTGVLVSLYQFRRHFTTVALLAIIRAHVFSHILYCLPVWASAFGSQLKRIQKLLHFAARVVTGTRRAEHMSPVLRSLGWLNNEDMISERDCIRVFRALRDPDANLRSLNVVRTWFFMTSHLPQHCVGRVHNRWEHWWIQGGI